MKDIIVKKKVQTLGNQGKSYAIILPVLVRDLLGITPKSIANILVNDKRVVITFSNGESEK